MSRSVSKQTDLSGVIWADDVQPITRETSVKSVLLSREGGRFLYGTSAFARLVERRPKFPGLSLQRAGVPANDPSNRLCRRSPARAGRPRPARVGAKNSRRRASEREDPASFRGPAQTPGRATLAARAVAARVGRRFATEPSSPLDIGPAEPAPEATRSQ